MKMNRQTRREMAAGRSSKCGFGIGSGQNRMGEILMQIREELLGS
jgi:predicted NAD-dependent protein-ADP-ribosyltransferase YbiA (DUF1768 family)